MYAKLFSQVVLSSLTQDQPIENRGVFFMLMAAADKSGYVLGTDEAIARIINVPIETFERALNALMKPDPNSQSKDFEGRRVIRIEDSPGLFVVNYVKYSGIASEEQRKEYFRLKKAESRARMKQSEADIVVGRAGQEAINGRLYGLPSTAEEVVAYGATLIPIVPAERCVAFFAYYEGQSRTDPNGNVFWVTKGEAVITNWKVKLPQFIGSTNQSNKHKPKSIAV